MPLQTSHSNNSSTKDDKPESLSTTQNFTEQIFKGLRTYILYFRYGNRPPMTKVFFHKGDKASAIERSKQHCEIMNYKFCGCYPFIVDLDSQERLRNDEIYEESF